jgi:phage head maturation protease
MTESRGSFTAEIKRVDTRRGQGRVQALVAVFGNVDRQGDRIMPGAFTRSLEEWRQRGTKIPVLWMHSDRLNDVVGTVDKASETEEGLQVTMQLAVDDSPEARTWDLRWLRVAIQLRLRRPLVA